MTDTFEYKCPACGGTVEFDSKSQKMKCIYCGTEMDLGMFEKAESSDAASSSSQTSVSGGSTAQSAYRTERDDAGHAGMKIYGCQSCGAEIVAEELTGSASCPYCGNHIVMKGVFEGTFRPDFIIPFKKDKKAAKEAYLNHLKGKSFLPKVFREENHIDEIKGIYVPFWLFSGDAEVSYSGNARKVRVWTSGNTEYTETEVWLVDRAGTASFEFVPVNGAAKIDDALMESIEPFNSAEQVPFQKAYLSGYMADRYDVNMEQSFDTAAQRMKNSAMSSLYDTIQGYSVREPGVETAEVRNTKHWFALYPVWILNTTWRGENYIFAMNGQTGKMVGDLPVDRGRFWSYTASRGVIAGIVLAVLAGFFL